MPIINSPNKGHPEIIKSLLKLEKLTNMVFSRALGLFLYRSIVSDSLTIILYFLVTWA